MKLPLVSIVQSIIRAMVRMVMVIILIHRKILIGIKFYVKWKLMLLVKVTCNYWTIEIAEPFIWVLRGVRGIQSIRSRSSFSARTSLF